jgi:hypothetical protein
MKDKYDFMYGVNKPKHLPTPDEIFEWACIFLAGFTVGVILF